MLGLSEQVIDQMASDSFNQSADGVAGYTGACGGMQELSDDPVLQ